MNKKVIKKKITDFSRFS